MPELENVETQKTAGYVDRGYNYSKRQKKLEEEEAEIARLEAIARGEIDPDEDDEAQQAQPNGKGREATEVQTSGSAKQEEANSSGEAQEDDDSDLSPEERSFKKRYGDVRRHLAEKEKEYKAKIEELEQAIKNGPREVRPPKSDEDIAQWASKYPDVASIVETIAAKKAQELFAKAETRLQEFDRIQYETERNKAENAIRKAHADFDELRDSDAFHDWANEQPKWVQDALYENSDDPASVIRVIDLYKVDTGKTPSDYKRKAKDAAKTVTKGQRTKVDTDGSEGTFKESQVARMSDKEYEDNMEAIDKAMRSGKFIYDISGGAR